MLGLKLNAIVSYWVFDARSQSDAAAFTKRVAAAIHRTLVGTNELVIGRLLFGVFDEQGRGGRYGRR